MTHLLTEEDCEALRTEYLAKAADAVGTSAWQPWMDAIQLLDTARSASFRSRAKLEGSPVAGKQPALGTATDDEL